MLFLSEQAEDAGLAAERREKALEGALTAAGLDLLLFSPLISQIKSEIWNQYDKKICFNYTV